MARLEQEDYVIVFRVMNSFRYVAGPRGGQIDMRTADLTRARLFWLRKNAEAHIEEWLQEEDARVEQLYLTFAGWRHAPL